jgi:hypothetical protein
MPAGQAGEPPELIPQLASFYSFMSFSDPQLAERLWAPFAGAEQVPAAR